MHRGGALFVCRCPVGTARSLQMQRMPKHLTRSLALIVTGCAAADLPAHGGQYRGPGSVVAPPRSSASPSSGGAYRGPGDVHSKSGSGNSGARAGGVGAPARSGPARTPSAAVARGYIVGDDLGRWEFWWEFGKDPFLNLRETLYEGRSADPERDLFRAGMAPRTRQVRPPTAADVREVAGAVAALLSKSRDRDTCSSCAIALAKIGSARAGFSVTEQLLPLLRRGDQELRETAALAMGISGERGEDGLRRLAALISDNADGQQMVGKGHVNERTRAFAAFGAGLLLQRSKRPAVAMRLVRPLLEVIERAPNHDRNLVVATIEALGLFPREWSGPAADALRERIVARLGAYYQRGVGAGRELIQAHVPTAIARIVEPRSRAASRWRDRFEADLRAGLRGAGAAAGAKVNHHIAQSCALALGRLCGPWSDENSQDHEACVLLTEAYEEHRDQQTRAFAALALARIGGAQARSFLLERLPKANKALEQPWIACALGVIAARERMSNPEALDQGGALQDLNDALVRAFQQARNPSTVGAIAISLGLTGSPEAKDLLRRRLVQHRKRDGVAGYVALSLGLLRDDRAVPDLRALLAEAARRPFVQLQAVRSLGLLGDPLLNEQLLQELQASENSVVRLSGAAAAIGQIGDRRCLPALLRLAQDRSAVPLSRAFAVVALGSVCDKETRPWSAAYATQINYRAATATLTDGVAGILDLL